MFWMLSVRLYLPSDYRWLFAKPYISAVGLDEGFRIGATHQQLDTAMMPSRYSKRDEAMEFGHSRV